MLIDLQLRHMAQDKKEIKGGAYTEENSRRCSAVKVIYRERQKLNADISDLSAHTASPARLNKYTKLYNLLPMGENEGVWFFKSNSAAYGKDCGGKAYTQNAIEEGSYAVAKLIDPLTFSANRMFNFICQWICDNKNTVNGILVCEEYAACFVKFYKENGKEYMDMYIPLAIAK
ncbi:MAG: hypothetical protein LBS21_04715 [Clostridiales bacterium]|jgi:hypothetical protein|nr:hypothetical protein [Clostridiales bacterium]